MVHRLCVHFFIDWTILILFYNGFARPPANLVKYFHRYPVSRSIVPVESMNAWGYTGGWSGGRQHYDGRPVCRPSGGTREGSWYHSLEVASQ